MVATLLIPAPVADFIFSRDNAFATEEVKEFRALSILWLECNGHKYEFTNVHVRGGDQKLHDVIVKTSGNNYLSGYMNQG